MHTKNCRQTIRLTYIYIYNMYIFIYSIYVYNMCMYILYNRLKQKHNPESEIITISKERYRKVKDVPWTLSKNITSVQESDQKTLSKNTAWVTYGFQNIDKVSCYANAVFYQKTIVVKL